MTCTPNPVTHGASSTCTATPKTGYTLGGFSGACTGASCKLTNVTEAQSVAANFSPKTYPIAAIASPAAGGTVTCTPNPATHGSASTCTATANAGYTFSAFSGACTGASCILTNVTAAKSVTASFRLKTYPVAAAANPVAGGTAICTPNPVSHGGSSTCTATPKTGYTLGGFSGACTGASCKLTNVTSAQSVTANFSPKTYPIAAVASPAAGGTVTCTPNPATHGSASACTATANAGYTFSAFSGACTGASCILTNVTAAKSVTASFRLKTYPIAAAANPVAGGTVTCTPSPVPHGGASTCTATPRVGYAFNGFSGACTGASCALRNVTEAQSVTASFAALTLRIGDAGQAEGQAGTSVLAFPVSLSQAGTGTVRVNYATANGSARAGNDYKSASGTLTFAPGEIVKSVSASLIGDTAVESDETFVVNLSVPSGATLVDSQGLGTVLNDD